MTTDDLPIDEAIDADETLETWDEPVPAIEESDEVAVAEETEEAEEEALDELEAEELDMLTEDESSEALAVDEAAELRAIRRAELLLEGEAADEASEDEFVCSSCFLVLKVAQLADARRRICRDCGA